MHRADQWASKPTTLDRGFVALLVESQKGTTLRRSVGRSLRTIKTVPFALVSLLVLGCGSRNRSDSKPDASTDSSPGQPSKDTEPSDPQDDTGTLDPDGDPAPPVVIRRLNKDQYDASIRDLFGRDFELAKDFPGEDPSLGFDNIATAMTLSPLQVELYERAAQTIVDYYTKPTPANLIDQRFEAESMTSTTGQACCGGFWNLFSNGSIEQSVQATEAGTYQISVRAYGQQMGEEATKLRIRVGTHLDQVQDITATKAGPQVVQFEVELPVGEHKIEVAFINDAYDPQAKTDRNLLIDWVKVLGPVGANPTPNPNLAPLLACKATQGQGCFKDWVQRFGLRVWRRPLKSNELQRFYELYDSKSPPQVALGQATAKALGGFLLSPSFLFRVEIDPEPEVPSSRELNGYELATRLSYFLWSSTPDQALLDLAKDDRLLEDATLAQQIKRMLQDPKAKALVHNFAGQWLSIRGLGDVFKDVQTFPKYTPSLVLSMRKEREKFFESFIDRDRKLQELLLSDRTFVNQELASFYGLPDTGVPQDEFVEVSLGDANRRGILGQAGLMAVLGHPETTAPVLRGKWVLEHLLCIEPPPPPDDIDISPIKPSGTETMREQLAQHRADPNCNGCHSLMDPIGLALENYDGIGQWRNSEGGQAIDASGELPDGTKIDGARELSQAIVQQPGFVRCAVRKALIYALGRDLHARDQLEFDAIVSTVKDSDLSFRQLLAEIVMSPLFRRRG